MAPLALTKQVFSGSVPEVDAHMAGGGPGLWPVAPGPAASTSAREMLSLVPWAQGWAILAGRAGGQAGADDFGVSGKGLAALGLS